MMKTTSHFSKFARPEQPRRGVITDRDLDIIEAVLRYRFSPTSELVRLVGGNEKVTQRRLRLLWEWQLLTRFAFPGIRSHSEFIYYLDTNKPLDLLVQHRRFDEIHPDMAEEARLNREADYAGAVTRGQHMKLGFLNHSLMISRLHFMLEMSARNSGGEIQFASWRQGAELRGHKVEVPEISSRRVEGTNEYIWEEHDYRKYRLPVEPDALFSSALCRWPDFPLLLRGRPWIDAHGRHAQGSLKRPTTASSSASRNTRKRLAFIRFARCSSRRRTNCEPVSSWNWWSTPP